MSDKTGIEWTDATWNPVRGCSRISEGCRHCYAERVAARFSRGASSDVGNVAEPQLFMGACPTTSARHLELVR
jgi:protein gp37